MHEMLVAVAIEGAPMRRAGAISLISISTLSGQVYLIDVQKCGKGLWDQPQGRKGHTLKHLLESRRTLKVMHDCRLSSDVLWHVARIQLNYVLDTQVAFKVFRNNQGVSNVLPIGSNKFCLMFLELDIANFTEIRREMKENPLYWKTRPVSSDAVAYLADLSSLLMSAWASFRPQVPEDLIQPIMQESYERLNEFREDEDPHPEVKGSEQFQEMIKNANSMEPPPPTPPTMIEQSANYSVKGPLQYVSPAFLKSRLMQFRFDALVVQGMLERMEAEVLASVKT